VLVVHGARNIDGWWQNGGIAPPLDSRLHDLSDAFAVPGPYSQATKFTGLSTTTAQLRTEDGTLHVELDAPNKRVDLVSNAISLMLDSNANAVTVTGSQTVSVTASSQTTVTAPTVTVNASSAVNITTPLVTINGNLAVTGTVVGGFGGGDQVGLLTHRHGTGNVAAGTISPTPGT
jgi:phage baseplate assembly protein V